MLKIAIPSASGVEAVVKRELARLGYPDSRTEFGRVEFMGDYTAVARCNMFLRSGERVLVQLDNFCATTFDQVYDAVYAIDWRALMPSDARILTYAKSVTSKLFAIKSLCSIVKKAIVDKLSRQYGTELPETGARYAIELSLRSDNAVLSLDTSGEGLHKRGYRDLAYSAPIKETLANALIDLSYYNADKYFADIFCGSGTIPIEAALRAKNIAPGLNRRFDYQDFSFIDKQLYARAKEEALDVARYDLATHICGYDIDENAVSIARHHAERANVKDIHFQVASADKFRSTHRYGVMISNPPYGMRLSEGDLRRLYNTIGDVYARLPDWNCYLITPYGDTERAFGRRADKKRKLYNANIECCYYSFCSKKPPKTDSARTASDANNIEHNGVKI